MKRLVVALSVFLLLGFGVSSTRAASSWKINDFHSDISILQDGHVDISERINVDFGTNSQHGIFRTIPITYTSRNGDLLYTALTIGSVTQDGQTAIFSTSNNNVNELIKIGDTNTLISGTHTYVIHYIVDGVLSSYDSYDELYWNVTGNGWPVPIGTASATVTLPTAGILQYSCYQGALGGTEKCDYSTVDKKVASFSASRVLQDSEGLTVAVGYTKGLFPIDVVSKPISTSLNFRTLAIQFFSTLVGGLVLILSYTLLIRRKIQKTIEAKAAESGSGNLTTIAVEYVPPFGLRPGQVGGVIDQKVNTLDITASIVDLAIRGYVTITEIPKTWALGTKDYKLTATSKTMDDLRPYEQLLLSKLFKGRSEVTMSQLKNTFYEDLNEIKDELHQDLVANGYFVTDPGNINNLLYRALVVLIITGVTAAAIGFYGVGSALIICALFATIAKKLIPEYSLLGRQAVQKILGYKLFVSATEKYRQPYLEKQHLYMEVLPYAIVFGVTAQLAQAFKEMGVTPPQPNWYISNQPFVAFAFASEMNNFSNQLSSTIASAPHSSGSGGGGFSGGGFGGGGGGSW